MTVDQLNARFGSPGRIVFYKGFAGYPNVVIANKYGTAEIALRLDEPRFYRVHSLALDGERRGHVQARVLNGRLVFTARVAASDGKARFL